jgi:hypothetical protein
MRRREVKRSLAQSLGCLASYCQQPSAKQLTLWPSRDFLQSAEADVGNLSATDRVSWKTFRRLDTRLPSLRLALRFDNLVNRAVARLKETPRQRPQHAAPLIQWLVRMGHPIVERLAGVNRTAALAVRKQARLAQHARREKEREAARLRKQRERLKKVRQNTVT